MKEKIEFNEIIPASDVLTDELEGINGGQSSEFSVCLKGCITGEKNEEPVKNTSKEEPKP
ncbi:MAG: hypothetical protein I3J02_10330 [Prevotella sp.]|nr:hypothetical protein [Prevotella sp.]